MNAVVGVVPAAGEGRRMFPGGGIKEALPLGSTQVSTERGCMDTPRFVGDFVIERLAVGGVARAVVVTSRNKLDALARHLDGSAHGIDVAFVVGTPTSMVASIDLAYSWTRESTVALGMPDTVIQPTDAFAQLLEFHRHARADVSLGLFPTDTPERFGMVRVDDDATVIYHKDKPKHTTASHMWGIAVWEPAFTAHLHAYERAFSAYCVAEPALGDVFDSAMAEGMVIKGFEVPCGRYYDVGTYDGYRQAVAAL